MYQTKEGGKIVVRSDVDSIYAVSSQLKDIVVSLFNKESTTILFNFFSKLDRRNVARSTRFTMIETEDFQPTRKGRVMDRSSLSNYKNNRLFRIIVGSLHFEIIYYQVGGIVPNNRYFAFWDLATICACLNLCKINHDVAMPTEAAEDTVPGYRQALANLPHFEVQSDSPGTYQVTNSLLGVLDGEAGMVYLSCLDAALVRLANFDLENPTEDLSMLQACQHVYHASKKAEEVNIPMAKMKESARRIINNGLWCAQAINLKDAWWSEPPMLVDINEEEKIDQVIAYLYKREIEKVLKFMKRPSDDSCCKLFVDFGLMFFPTVKGTSLEPGECKNCRAKFSCGSYLTFLK